MVDTTAFRPRWAGNLLRWTGPKGKTQIGTSLRRAARSPAGDDNVDLPEPVLRLAQAEYDRQYPGQPYERMQERGGLSVFEVISFLADTVERQAAEIEELKVRDIVSRNPGIDIDEVRRSRAARIVGGTDR